MAVDDNQGRAAGLSALTKPGVPAGSRLPVAQILAAGLGMCGGMAVLYMTTMSVFMKPMVADLGWNRAQVSMLMTAAFLGYATGSPVLGAMFDKAGARRVLACGIVGLAAGLLLMSNLDLTPWQAAGLALAIGFVGSATAPSGYILILTKIASRRLGLVLALAMLGYGAGVTLSPIMGQLLIDGLGWRGAYGALAGLAALLGGAALLLGIGRGASPSTEAPSAGEAEAVIGLTLREALRDYRYWIIGATALMLAVAGFGMTVHIVAILSDRGMTALVAAQAAGALGGGMFIGRVIAAVLMDRIFAPFVAIACTLLGGLGLFLVWTMPVDQAFALFAAAFLIGLLTGSEGDTMPFLTRCYFGTRSFGAIYGSIIGIAATGGIIGPYAFGWTFDRTGSYDSMLIVCMGLCAFSVLLFGLLGRYRFPVAHGHG